MSAGAAAASFARLWLVLFFAFFVLKTVFNLLVFGWIDLRPVALLELLVLPLGQSVIVYAIARGRRRPEMPS